MVEDDVLHDCLVGQPTQSVYTRKKLTSDSRISIYIFFSLSIHMTYESSLLWLYMGYYFDGYV